MTFDAMQIIKMKPGCGDDRSLERKVVRSRLLYTVFAGTPLAASEGEGLGGDRKKILRRDREFS